jgi:hypothetical protein
VNALSFLCSSAIYEPKTSDGLFNNLLRNPWVICCFAHLAQAKHSSSGACYNIGDAGAEWLRGYHAGQAAEKGNSPGFSNANNADFQSGFDQGFADSKRGVNGPFC